VLFRPSLFHRPTGSFDTDFLRKYLIRSVIPKRGSQERPASVRDAVHGLSCLEGFAQHTSPFPRLLSPPREKEPGILFCAITLAFPQKVAVMATKASIIAAIQTKMGTGYTPGESALRTNLAERKNVLERHPKGKCHTLGRLDSRFAVRCTRHQSHFINKGYEGRYCLGSA
jgi:hypothetical protein